LKTKVIEDLCIECGLCVSNCPDIFYFGDDGKAQASNDEVAKEFEEAVLDSIDGCPTTAIEKY
jgi:ferredoxin